MALPTVITEKDSAGRTRRILFGENDTKVCSQIGKDIATRTYRRINDTIRQVTGVTDAKGVSSHLETRLNLNQLYILDILRRMFLPAGFPNTVSPGAWLFHNKYNTYLNCNDRLPAVRCQKVTSISIHRWLDIKF